MTEQHIAVMKPMIEQIIQQLAIQIEAAQVHLYILIY